MQISDIRIGDRVASTVQGAYYNVGGRIVGYSAIQYGNFKRYVIELDIGKTICRASNELKLYAEPQVDTRKYLVGEKVKVLKSGTRGIIMRRNNVQVPNCYTKYVVMLQNGKQVVLASNCIEPLKEE